MSRVLVIAGHHEGELFSVPGKWPFYNSYRLPIRPDPIAGWNPGPIKSPDIECVDYHIYQIRYRNPDRVWYVAMPTNDLRDPAIVAMDSMFRTAEVKALGE